MWVVTWSGVRYHVPLMSWYHRITLDALWMSWYLRITRDILIRWVSPVKFNKISCTAQELWQFLEIDLRIALCVASLWEKVQSVSEICHNSWTVQDSLMKLHSWAQLIKMCVMGKNENSFSKTFSLWVICHWFHWSWFCVSSFCEKSDPGLWIACSSTI